MKKTITGFTIVELLIVIVVIAILATITIVAYNGIQNRANDAAVQSDLRNFGAIMAQQKAMNDTYPATLTPAMGIRFSKGAYGLDQQSRNARYCMIPQRISMLSLESLNREITSRLHQILASSRFPRIHMVAMCVC